MSKKNKKLDVFKHVDMSGGPDACWPWTLAANGQGRPYFTVDGEKILAYRLVYELITGEELGDLIIRHTCDNSICCNPSHHVPGTQDENIADMQERERNGLPAVVVKPIRRLADAGTPHETIAELYGIARSTVTGIANRTYYKQVSEDA